MLAYFWQRVPRGPVVSRDIDESEFSLVRDKKTAGWVIADLAQGRFLTMGNAGFSISLANAGR
jgi:hypothetical protein